jgi:hypothetical protein
MTDAELELLIDRAAKKGAREALREISGFMTTTLGTT